MTDPTLADTTNPMNLRRLRWHDSTGRLCTEMANVTGVTDVVESLKKLGVKTVAVERLTWTKVYEATL